MKRLLLQAAKSPLFLRRPEGRRFLGHVLTLHPSLVAEMASVMRNMVRGEGCVPGLGAAPRPELRLGAAGQRGSAARRPSPARAAHQPPLPQVVTGKQWVLEAVGEIILRGWREAAGPCVAAIEGTLIQGFARACLHASSRGLASNVLVVLHQLHEAKRLGPGAAGGGSNALDGALVRLYEPLLYRWAVVFSVCFRVGCV
jgi:hypothetical protein